MGVQVIPVPTKVVSHSLPFPFPILCLIAIPVGFPFPLGIPFPCTSLVQRSLKVVWNVTIQWSAYVCNYRSMLTYLYRFSHTARCWSKIAKFIYTTCMRRPCREWPRRNFAKVFSTGKTKIMGLPMLKRYNTGTWQTDGQTDGRTEVLYQHRASTLLCWCAIVTGCRKD